MHIYKYIHTYIHASSPPDGKLPYMSSECSLGSPEQCLEVIGLDLQHPHTYLLGFHVLSKLQLTGCHVVQTAHIDLQQLLISRLESALVSLGFSERGDLCIRLGIDRRCIPLLPSLLSSLLHDLHQCIVLLSLAAIEEYICCLCSLLLNMVTSSVMDGGLLVTD